MIPETHSKPKPAEESATRSRLPISVIVPVLNEELNLEACLESVVNWAGEIVVIDAGSEDNTLVIANRYTDKVYNHHFGRHKYSEQKNWVLTQIALKFDWVLFLDADERVTPELVREMTRIMHSESTQGIDGFKINIRLIFLGRSITHGAFSPNWALRLFRRDRVRFVNIDGLEYAQAQGLTRRIKGLIVHKDSKDLTAWITKQNERSSLEARAILEEKHSLLNQKASGWSKVERRGNLKLSVWSKLPSFIRPLLLFLYSYFLRFGFIDGREGLIYSFLLAFWYRFLVDAKYLELEKKINKSN